MDKKHFKQFYNSLDKELSEDEKTSLLSALIVEKGFAPGFSDRVLESINRDRLDNAELFFNVMKNQFRNQYS